MFETQWEIVQIFGDASYAKNNKKASVSVWSEIKDMIK